MRSPARIWAVVPVKEFDGAKGRLSTAYPPEFRHGLAQAMVEDVLCALAEVPQLAGITVVTVDRDAVALAKRFGARIFDQGARSGHTQAVRNAARQVANDEVDGMLTVPGDIPCITKDEVSTLISSHRASPAFTIVPAHDRRGSNAIIVSPPDAVPLSFGDDSFLPHIEAARRIGIEPTVLTLFGIGLDIDTTHDLDQFMQKPSPTRTWSFLVAQGLVPAPNCRMAKYEHA